MDIRCIRFAITIPFLIRSFHRPDCTRHWHLKLLIRPTNPQVMEVDAKDFSFRPTEPLDREKRTDLLSVLWWLPSTSSLAQSVICWICIVVLPIGEGDAWDILQTARDISDPKNLGSCGRSMMFGNLIFLFVRSRISRRNEVFTISTLKLSLPTNHLLGAGIDLRPSNYSVLRANSDTDYSIPLGKNSPATGATKGEV